MSIIISSINYCPVKSVSFQSIDRCKIKKKIGVNIVAKLVENVKTDQAKIEEVTKKSKKESPETIKAASKENK